jgi:aspartate/methionine/tyrosine aminotransferase
MNSNIGDIGRGFAAFLSPPPEGVVRFTVGQPDFRTPQPVVDAAKSDLDNGLHGYTRSQGSEEICQAVANYLTKYNLDIDHNDVLVSPGCKQALLYAMMSCLNPGDEVILFAPAWPSYDGMLKLIGAVPVHVPVKRENYHPDMDATRAAITSKTKAIVINSPNNPTGAVYLPSEIEELTQIAAENDLGIFDDMIYSDLVYSEHSYVSPASLEAGKDRTLTIGGWSKIWAMTGWRLGWITGPTEVMEGVKTCQASSASHVPTFLMGAGAVALGLEEDRISFFESFAERRDVFHALLQEIPGIKAPKPEGAFYILADITETGMDDIEFATRALDEAGVQLVPGSLMPGGEGLVRMSYGTNLEQIREGCKRLKDWLQD